MAFMNRSGSEYLPLGEPGVDIDTRPPIEDDPQVYASLYYRSQTFPGLLTSVEQCRQGTEAYENLEIDAEQAWNETAWKEPHGTRAAHERFLSKFLEERTETENALEEFWETGNPIHFVEEIGDLKWITMALASNAGVAMSDAVKNRLYSYIVGTKQYIGETLVHPGWYDEAARAATKRGSLRIKDVDDLINVGFIPQMSAVMNIGQHEVISPLGYLNDLLYLSVLINAGNPGDGTVTKPLFEEQPAAKAVAEMYLRIAAMAHYAGSSMSQVVQINVQKITERVSKNQIDKEDGGRE